VSDVAGEGAVRLPKPVAHRSDLPDDGDDYGFLSDYYSTLCAHLEAGLMVGRRRENKFG
jgi:hypothetical protein